MRPYLLLASVLALPAMAADNAYVQQGGKLGQDQGLAFSFFAGYTGGGDSFVVDNYSGGSEKVRFGSRYHLGLGAQWEKDSFGAAFNVGYQFNNDGDLNLKRYTLELLPFYQMGRHKFSVGPSWHFDVKSDIKLDGNHEKFKFKDALGAIVQYDYQLDQHNWVGVRYQWVEYELDKYNGVSMPGGTKGDGNQWGFYYRSVF
ncbi:hypothetical protein PVT67_05490 [Gallaecimonas kandeliae]|uniref:hypothetical protein n=1 Tax=Gallaecimonas kandeliae TaxID=3029055 RepID=UPI0026481823|nr:hypothetical protein [Gallaecimonas kandeliae]WKE66696.1 hypothetical protein PVT67_05490 [Gallaecimonas kandeliae]